MFHVPCSMPMNNRQPPSQKRILQYNPYNSGSQSKRPLLGQPLSSQASYPPRPSSSFAGFHNVSSHRQSHFGLYHPTPTTKTPIMASAGFKEPEFDEDVPPVNILQPLNPNVLHDRKPAAKPTPKPLFPNKSDDWDAMKEDSKRLAAELRKLDEMSEQEDAEMCKSCDDAVSASAAKQCTKYVPKSKATAGEPYNAYPKKVTSDMFGYTRKHENMSHCVFECSTHRSTDCPAKLKMSEWGDISKIGQHVPACYKKNGLEPPRPEGPPILKNVAPDITEEMKAFVDRKALEDLKNMPKNIVRECFDHFAEKYGRNWVGLKRQEVMNRVHNTRRVTIGMGGGAKYKLIAEAMASGSKSMMRFDSTSLNGETKEEVMGFSHPLLLSMLRRSGMQIMVDATFSSVPRPYYQCLIVMAYDSAFDVYFPCYYVLMSSKSEKCYDEAFHQMKKDLEDKFDPACVGVDFEPALIKSVRNNFPNAIIVGCFFHFKQAIRRKLQEMGFPPEVIAHIMSWGVLDLLTVLPKADVETIESKGILYVAMLIESGDDAAPIKVEGEKPIPIQVWMQSPKGKELMCDFWKYFSNQWLKKKGMINLWNRSADSSLDFELHGRTNCALENLNARFNNAFPARHPSLLAFAQGLEEHIAENAARYRDVLEA